MNIQSRKDMVEDYDDLPAAKKLLELSRDAYLSIAAWKNGLLTVGMYLRLSEVGGIAFSLDRLEHLINPKEEIEDYIEGAKPVKTLTG